MDLDRSNDTAALFLGLAFLLGCGVLAGVGACAGTGDDGGSATPAAASAFVDSAESALEDVWQRAGRASWVQSNFITYDTELLYAQANEVATARNVRFATDAARFDGLDLDSDTQRKLHLLKAGLTAPAPADQAKTAELAQILARMESTYGSGEYCPDDGGPCLDLEELSAIIASSRNADSLLLAWQGWRTISPPMRDDFERFVELTNEGAQALGFADLAGC